MAVIRPFRGVRYNQDAVPDLSQVVTQPYDRITPELQTRYYEQHPDNYVRLIQNQPTPDDTPQNNVYTRAAATYRRWLAESVLVRDALPGLYVYHQAFTTPDGARHTRKAFVAALELTDFKEGVVLPHERTLSGPKADRLNLMRAVDGVNVEPVFVLYPDRENAVNAALDAVIAEQPPVADVRELFEHEVQHRVWVVTQPEILDQVRELMRPKRNLIIADGHHRYETALEYQKERRAAFPDAPAGAAWDFVLTALVSMSDPGLVILPTHRLVHSYDRLSTADLLASAAAYFQIKEMPNRAALVQAMKEVGLQDHAIGFDDGARQSLWLLRDVGVMETLVPDRAPAWRELDVSILHQVVLETLLGLTAGSIQRQENLSYLRDPEAGYRALDEGQAQFLFQLNATRMQQVRACTQVGEKMPQKSTDFFPKMIGGLVVLPE